MFSICPQFISHDVDRENLFDNQEHLRLAILTLISMFESAVTLCVEISHLALSNRGGLRCFLFKVLLIECNLIENKLPGFCMQGVWNLFIPLNSQAVPAERRVIYNRRAASSGPANYVGDNLEDELNMGKDIKTREEENDSSSVASYGWEWKCSMNYLCL